MRGPSQVFLAAAADSEGNVAQRTAGLYYDLMKPSPPTAAATDAATARRLWEVSERLTGVKMGI